MLTRLKRLIALLLLFCSGLVNIAYSQQVEINKDAVNQLQSNLAGTPLGQNVEEFADKVKSAIEVLKQLQSSLESGPIGSAIKIMTDSAHINVYPMFHIAADSALWPYALELYFDVRAERKEPYILVTLNFTPESGEWTDFDSYKLSVSLTQGKTKAIPQEVVLPVEKELNKILANIGNLKKYFGDIRDNVADAIRKLRMAMMDKYWEGKNLPQVNFYAASNALYGFDPPVQQAIIRKYKDFYRYDTVTLAPWKSLSTEKADKVNAFVTIRDTAFKKSQIRFIDRNNVQVQPIETKNDTLVFSLTGLSDGDEGELTAEYFQNDTIAKKERKAPLAQVKTIAYGKCPQTHHIVPVNNATYPGNTDAIKKYLNNAYKQAVVTWDVVPEKKLDVKDWDLDGDGKLNIETSILQRYSDEENAFITAWETDHKNSDDKAAYLFIVDMPNTLNARGYMPLNSHYGFIFVGGDNASVHEEVYYNTMAHELGHGIFKMYHAWDEYGTPERQTNNLMDYQQGAVLWKPQWDWMHDPGIRTYMFQSEDEGALSKNYEIQEVTFQGDATSFYTVYSDKNKTPYNAPQFTKNVAYPVAYLNGTQMNVSLSFELSDKSLESNTIKIRGVVTNFRSKNDKSSIHFEETKAIKDPTITDKSIYKVTNLICTAKFPDGINYFDPLIINWEISFDGATWTKLGVSKNRIYVLAKAPGLDQGEPLFETLLYSICKNAIGKSKPQEIIDDVWKYFSKRKVTDANKVPIDYWRSEETAGNSLSQMLTSNDGKCQAWADFFYQILKVLDVDRINYTKLYLRSQYEYPKASDMFVIGTVFKSDMSYTATCDPSNFNLALLNQDDKGGNLEIKIFHPSQNNETQGAVFFSNHYVVWYNGYIYDASYGGDPIAIDAKSFIMGEATTKDLIFDINKSENLWEKLSVGGFIIQGKYYDKKGKLKTGWIGKLNTSPNEILYFKVTNQ